MDLLKILKIKITRKKSSKSNLQIALLASVLSNEPQGLTLPKDLNQKGS